jgi:hypothetical protein
VNFRSAASAKTAEFSYRSNSLYFSVSVHDTFGKTGSGHFRLWSSSSTSVNAAGTFIEIRAAFPSLKSRERGVSSWLSFRKQWLPIIFT